MTRLVLAIFAVSLQPGANAPAPDKLFEHGRTFEQFVDHVTAQRDLWRRNTNEASVAPELVQRLARVGNGLRVLVVAEDWCPDSVNTVPFVAALASLAQVGLRIVDRAEGGSLMARHPASDGRLVTPTIILLRADVDVGAWVERPEPLQSLFHTLSNPESARLFAQRQVWYDADRGRTALSEFVALAERTATGR
jgi:hypothetical protein